MQLQMTSPPAWSFAGKHKKKIKEDYPGPGTYSTSFLNNTISYKIGKSKRN